MRVSFDALQPSSGACLNRIVTLAKYRRRRVGRRFRSDEREAFVAQRLPRYHVRQQSGLDDERCRRDAQRVGRLRRRLVLANHLIESRLRIAAGAHQILLCVVDCILIERRDRLRQLELIVQSRRFGHARLRDGGGEPIDRRFVRGERLQRLLKSRVDLRGPPG